MSLISLIMWNVLVACCVLTCFVAATLSTGESCRYDEFACDDGTECIPVEFFCNGYPDCNDQSDEPLRNDSLTYDRNATFCRGWSGNRTCVLPDNLVGEKDRICEVLDGPCNSDEFPCANGFECIRSNRFCDGKMDCSDESDEPYYDQAINYGPNVTLCFGITSWGFWRRSICVVRMELVPRKADFCAGESCGRDEFPCANGIECIVSTFFCDGSNHCRDGSDEIYYNQTTKYGPNATFCHGEYTWFSTQHYICVVPTKLSRTSDFCEVQDGSCKSDEFPCANGFECIRSSFFCDGKIHCSDESDEPYYDQAINYGPNVTLCLGITSWGLWRRFICVVRMELVPRKADFCAGESCGRDDFPCANGFECILSFSFCDGTNHCRDGSDEIYYNQTTNYGPNVTFCHGSSDTGPSTQQYICVVPTELSRTFDFCEGKSSTCSHEEFRCSDGFTCILRSNFCNGFAQCSDGSDEIDSKLAAPGQRTCSVSHHTKKCAVPHANVCSGQSVCKHHVDNCLCGKHADYFLDEDCFKCLSDHSVVIPISHLCDGSIDCPDFSDECLCTSINWPQICHKLFLDFRSPVRCVSYVDNRTQITVTSGMRCDDRVDCVDASDEESCSGDSRKVSPTYKKRLTVCPQDARCNGIPECTNYLREECNCEVNPSFCKFVPKTLFGTPGCRWNGIGKYLPAHLICDGVKFCDYFEDELGCGSSRFNCTVDPLPSIPVEKLCDQHDDCENGADERNCSQFYCNDSGSLNYIRRSAVCDGIQDCEEGYDECQPGCIKSAFSDEQSLIQNKAVLTLVWIISVTAIIGGLAVMAMVGYQLVNQDTNASTGATIINRFILSLAVSDFLVGMYTMAICIKAVQMDEDYCVLDRPWRSSVTCSTLGAMLVIGSEQSVLTMVLIASYRLKAVARPFSYPSNRQSIILILLSWLISILLGVLPLFPHVQDYFVSSITFNENPIFKIMYYNETEYMIHLLSGMQQNESGIQNGSNWNRIEMLVSRINPNITVSYRFGYYSSHTVCLPTFFPDRRVDLAWGYSLLLLVINFTAFLFTLIAYIILYRTATSSGKDIAKMANFNKKGRMEENIRMQRKLTRIVVSDFFCWMPICIMGFLQLGGVDIPKDAYLPAGLLIIPINSALNPLLYSDLPEIVWERVQTCGRFLRSKAHDELVVVELRGEMHRGLQKKGPKTAIYPTP